MRCLRSTFQRQYFAGIWRILCSPATTGVGKQATQYFHPPDVNPEVFYLHIRGEQRGPYTVSQIDHLLNSGLIDTEVMFWREGLEQWQPVTNLVALRKKPRRWVVPGLFGAFLLFLLILHEVFGSTIRVGWKEAAQPEYTDGAAYWRARDFVRHGAVPSGSLVEFESMSLAQITLNPPSDATVILHGSLVDRRGELHPARWSVRLHYDIRLREWNAICPPEYISNP